MIFGQLRAVNDSNIVNKWRNEWSNRYQYQLWKFQEVLMIPFIWFFFGVETSLRGSIW